MLRPLRLVPDDTKIGFMQFSRPAIMASIAACVASVLLFAIFSLNYGIDFKGGTLFEIRTEQPADIGALRDTLRGLDLGDIELQEFGAPTDVLIRVESQPGGEDAQQGVITKVKGALGSNVDYRRVEVVGPKVSGELKQDGTIAVILSILAVMIYIWFRFEWQFAVGAVASLSHDVLLTIGLFAVLGIEFNLSIIAAILTIVGYSLNDTVVVYDRVRENMRRYKKMPLSDLIDLSLNQMLPRTIMTSLSTLLALGALYVFGGEVIRGFTFTMIWGVIIGTYSSVFIAAPVLIYFGARIDQMAGGKDKTAEATRP